MDSRAHSMGLVTPMDSYGLKIFPKMDNLPLLTILIKTFTKQTKVYLKKNVLHRLLSS